MHRLIILPFGPPGVGKGTQAKILSERLGIPHIASGDLFRENIKNETAIGKEIKELYEAGKFAGDDLVIDMVFERLAKSDCARGFILDGTPRTVNQAVIIDERLGEDDEVIVFHFSAPDDVVIRRICGRLLCKECHAMFNKELNPPKKEGICDFCSGELYRRSDDGEEVVKERLALYKKETAPLTDYYASRLITIDCTGAIDDIAKQVQTELRKHLPKSLI